VPPARGLSAWQTGWLINAVTPLSAWLEESSGEASCQQLEGERLSQGTEGGHGFTAEISKPMASDSPVC